MKTTYVRNSLRNKYVYEDLKLHNNQGKTNKNKMTKKCPPKHMRMMSSKTKNYIQEKSNSIYIQQQNKKEP